jgi:hypothetical protein
MHKTQQMQNLEKVHHSVRHASGGDPKVRHTPTAAFFPAGQLPLIRELILVLNALMPDESALTLRHVLARLLRE